MKRLELFHPNRHVFKHDSVLASTLTAFTDAVNGVVAEEAGGAGWRATGGGRGGSDKFPAVETGAGVSDSDISDSGIYRIETPSRTTFAFHVRPVTIGERPIKAALPAPHEEYAHDSSETRN